MRYTQARLRRERFEDFVFDTLIPGLAMLAMFVVWMTFSFK